ncbi:MAG: S-layer homology domain-containing protein, partial [Thermoanaerobaculia bacterium]
VETEVFSPVALEVDPDPLGSDGNGVFEPEESVEVAPSWRNDGMFAQTVTGAASGFTGPPGPNYVLVDGDAAYGTVDPGAIAGCQDLAACYAMEIGPPGVERPAVHWDASFDETLSEESAKTWTLHIGDSFLDVPRSSLFYSVVETFLHNGVSSDPLLARFDLPLVGCSDTEFCPALPNSRAEAAVFLLKGLEGGGFDPPDCVSGSELFDDVPADDPFCPWIEELAGRGVTAGCGGGNYCPNNTVSRDQIAVFLLKTLEAPGYTPPACTGVFEDVSCPSLFADWIEDLFARGVTAGCGAAPARYCPADAVRRAQTAALVVKMFELALYGP